jgi:hypothetical protein
MYVFYTNYIDSFLQYRWTDKFNIAQNQQNQKSGVKISRIRLDSPYECALVCKRYDYTFRRTFDEFRCEI